MAFPKTTVVAAVGLAVLLGGCTQGGEPAPDPTVTDTSEPAPAPSPTETATPTPEPDPAVVPEVGAFVTEDEAQAARDAGLGVFVTADGELLVIDPTQPLPDVVIDEFRETGADAAGSDTAADDDAVVGRLNEVGKRVTEAGRIPIFIISNGSYDQYGNREAVGYSAISTDYATHRTLGAQQPSGDLRSNERALQIAHDTIAAHPTPDLVEIIDTTGW